MTLQWEKVASASIGGKPFFYIARPVMNGMKRKYCVAWHRQTCKWVASFDDMQTCLVPEEYGSTKTAQEAQAILETDYQAYLAKEEVTQ